MKKKLLAALLCAAMVFSVCACGDNSGDDTEKNSQNVQVDPPTVTSLATVDDLKAILVGEYEITDEYISNGFTTLIFGAGGGLVEVTDRDVVQAGDVVLTGYAGTPNAELAATLTEDELEDLTSGMTTTKGYEQYIDVSNNVSIDETSGETSSYISGDWGTFSEGLIGAKVGEAKDHKVIFPDSYSNETLEGQEVTFTFTVQKIYTKITLDNVTDEYIAEYLGEDYDVQNKEEIIAYIKKALSYSAVVDYAITNSAVTIPENYLDYRADLYIDYMDSMYSSMYGVTFEYFLTMYYGQTLDEAKVDVMEWLKESVIPYEVVYKEYAKSMNLEIDEEALEENINSIVEANSSYYSSADDIYANYGAGDAEAGKDYLLYEAAFAEYFEKIYGASIAVTE